jgi:hypothetical protein
VKHRDAEEARAWVAVEVERLRGLAYDDLVQIVDRPQHRLMETANAKTLTLESQVFWDDVDQQNIRVLVDVWDQSKRVSFGSIAKDAFVRAPDGWFVGE